MSMRRKWAGGALAVLGFLLSPLSWWNDLFVNVPLALAFAWPISWFWPQLFGVSFVVGYWLTNVAGLWLMHVGVQHMRGKAAVTSGAAWRGHLLTSLAYTLLLVVLLALKILKPLPDYFPAKQP